MALGIAGVVPLVAQSPASAVVAPGTDDTAVVSSTPDRASAVAAAMAQGSRVEITDDRTETATTWANPDGTLTTDTTIAPIRIRNDQGAWEPVDYDLAPTADGGFAPKASPVDVTFSGGGNGPAATADKGAKELNLSPTPPRPTSGTRAMPRYLRRVRRTWTTRADRPLHSPRR